MVGRALVDGGAVVVCALVDGRPVVVVDGGAVVVVDGRPVVVVDGGAVVVRALLDGMEEGFLL